MTDEGPLQQRLVDAGVALLEQVGAAGLGLRAIAREAGVSHGAPRRWFPTHKSLLAAIAARGIADLATRFASHTESDPHARLLATATDYVAFATERREMFALMFRHDLLEGSGRHLREDARPLFATWSALVSACAPDPTGTRAVGLWANLHGIATLVANRTLEPIAPAVDTESLVAAALSGYLGIP